MGAFSSKESAAKANLLGKRNLEDDLENKPILKRHKETSEEKDETTTDSLDQANLISVNETVEGLDGCIPIPEAVSVTNNTLLLRRLSREAKLPDIISFFSDVGDVVYVRLIVGHGGKKRSYAFVELSSANEVKMALEKKHGEYLNGRQISLYMADFNKAAYLLPKYCKEYDSHSHFEHYLRRESLLIEEDDAYGGFDDISDSAEKVLAVANLSPYTKISDIKGLFTNMGVISVRLIVNNQGKHLGYAFVEFSCAYDANKALKEKNGEYLHDHKIFLMREHDETPDYVEALEKKNGEYLHDSKIVLEVAEAPYDPPKYCIDYNVWYEDYLSQESLLMGENDEVVKGLDETPDFVEPFAVTNKTLFVSGLAFHTNFSDIVSFFEDVGEVVRVRIVIDHRGNHVGCGFIEFASTEEAEEAVEKKNGVSLYYSRYFKISLQLAEIAAPYPLPPKYDLVERLWYEDKLRGGSLDVATKPNLKKPEVAEFCGKKIIFSYDD